MHILPADGVVLAAILNIEWHKGWVLVVQVTCHHLMQVWRMVFRCDAITETPSNVEGGKQDMSSYHGFA